METLNKKALAEVVVEKLGCSKKDALETVELIFAEMTNTLKNEGKVDISGFGKFEVKTRAARTGVNPATMEKINIAASKAPAFKAAKALKESVK